MKKKKKHAVESTRYALINFDNQLADISSGKEHIDGFGAFLQPSTIVSRSFSLPNIFIDLTAWRLP